MLITCQKVIRCLLIYSNESITALTKDKMCNKYINEDKRATVLIKRLYCEIQKPNYFNTECKG